MSSGRVVERFAAHNMRCALLNATKRVQRAPKMMQALPSCLGALTGQKKNKL